MRIALVALLAAVLPPWAAALDGFAVTTHSTFGEDNANDPFGEIVRHDIVNSAVAKRSVLFAGPARKPVINPEGTLVAIVKQDGTLAVMPAAGGPLRDLVQAHPGSHLDFVGGGWIYYNLGSSIDAGGRKLRRVNATSGKDEKVVDLDPPGGEKVWRWGVSTNGTRMHIDRSGGDAIWTYDLAANVFTGTISGVPGYPDNGGSCNGAISPGGMVIMAGHDSHQAMHILDWSTRKEVFSFAYGDGVKGLARAPWVDSRLGAYHERNAWSCNSDDWLLLHLMGGSKGAEFDCGNQVAVDWRNRTSLAITANAPGSGRSDCAGDLWVAPTARR